MNTQTENAIFIYNNNKVVGFISRNKECGHSVVYSCERMVAEDIAQIINPEHNIISRKIELTDNEL